MEEDVIWSDLYEFLAGLIHKEQRNNSLNINQLNGDALRWIGVKDCYQVNFLPGHSNRTKRAKNISDVGTNIVQRDTNDFGPRKAILQDIISQQIKT